jgi:hypothetical protein
MRGNLENRKGKGEGVGDHEFFDLIDSLWFVYSLIRTL